MAINLNGAKTSTSNLVADTGLLFGPLDVKNNYVPFTVATAPFTASSYLPVQMSSGTLPPTLTQVLPYNFTTSTYTTNIPQTVSAAFEINSISGAFLMPRMNTAQQGALVATNGMQIYNTDFGTVDFFINGGWIPGNSGSANIKSVAVNYAADANDYFIACTVGSLTITLPEAVTTTNYGKLVVVADASGTAAADHITINVVGSTINGGSSVTLSTNYGALRFYSLGTSGWFTW